MFANLIGLIHQGLFVSFEVSLYVALKIVVDFRIVDEILKQVSEVVLQIYKLRLNDDLGMPYGIAYNLREIT